MHAGDPTAAISSLEGSRFVGLGRALHLSARLLTHRGMNAYTDLPHTARSATKGSEPGKWQDGSVTQDADRSTAQIELADLHRLGELAAEAEAELFRRNPQGSGRYAGRLLCRALRQGTALHYLHGDNGVKDFDVWSFYAADDDWPFPARWRGTRDFGASKFGRYPDDPSRYAGRRVDLLGRSLPVPMHLDPAHALRQYLAARRTNSAKALAAKAVVLIHPLDRVGEIVWPMSEPAD